MCVCARIWVSGVPVLGFEKAKKLNIKAKPVRKSKDSVAVEQRHEPLWHIALAFFL